MTKFLLFASLVVFSGSCRYLGGERIRGNGVIKLETRATGSFSSVDVSSNIDLYLTQDSAASLKLETDENLLAYIEIRTDGDKLIIKTKKGYHLSGTKAIKAYVSAPLFRNIDASGSCDIFGQNSISQGEELKMDLSGSTEVKLDIKSPKISASLSGSGELNIRGETKEFSVDGSGSTTVNCPELMAEKVSVEISGSGEAEVFASLTLDVSISGSGSVKYRGNASVKQSVSGSGSVTKIQ